MRDGTITFRLVFIVNVLCEECQHQNEETEKEKRGAKMRDGTITFRLVFIVNVLCEECQHQNEETEKEKRGQRFCGVNC